MIKNFLKIAIRTLSRRKSYTIINVLGLSTGLACSTFIFHWVYDEFHYDTFYPKKDLMYRIVAEVGVGQDRWEQAVTSLPLGPALESTFPEVQTSVRLAPADAMIEHNDQRFIEDNIVITDPSFFNFFDYHLLKGNEQTALVKPYQMVLTESMAKKYFGEADPVGQLLHLYLLDPEGNGTDYEITGVIENPHPNSHITFNFLTTMATIDLVDQRASQEWFNNSYYTYLCLKEGTDHRKLEEKLPAFVKDNMGEANFHFFLQPIEQIHLYSDLLYDAAGNGSIEYVWIFSAVGIFLLAIAGINYVNLSTAFSLERVKEVGVRKVLGAFKTQIIAQHMAETAILTLISLILGGLLVEILKPYFYELVDKDHLELGWNTIMQPLFVFCILLILTAGIMPAYLLAKLNTITSLKGKVEDNAKGVLRRALVAFQFVITLIILVGVIVVDRQLEFVQDQDLGYDQRNLLLLWVNGSPGVIDGFEPFREELLSYPNTQNVARSNTSLVYGLSNSTGTAEGDTGEKVRKKLYRLVVDHEYIRTYGMQIMAGRDFSPGIQSDSTEAFVLNLAAVRGFGWEAEEAIGKRLEFNGRKGQIIGVVRDFHFNSLHHAIEPVCMYLSPGDFSLVTIKAAISSERIAQVQNIWEKHFPDAPFDFGFQDETLFQQYQSEQRLGQIFDIFSVISALIAFLGLFGLVGYTVRRKTKEIGIRKVLGASVVQILNLISHQFIVIIGLAAIIAFPLSWWLMESWLQDFTYRIDFSIWFFIIAGVTLLLMALTVITMQALRSSLTNPADALKEE